MPHDIMKMCAEAMEENNEEELMDFLSDNDGEDFDDIEPPVKFDQSFPYTVLVANAPQVGPEKYDKLKGVLSKLINKHGETTEIVMPMNQDTQKTYGMLLATYSNTECAQKCISTMNGMALDKTHTLKVVSLDAYNAIMQRPDTFQAKSNLSVHSRADFRNWLLDNKCREQFLIRYHDQTEIFWHDTHAGTPQLAYGGEREKASGKVWCDWVVQWSPHGSYLATFHKPGIALWAGDSFERRGRLVHDGDNKYLEFSPNEEFALTWDGKHAMEASDASYRIFRVLTGETLFRRKTPEKSPTGEFPHFLWSPDGKYFAECNETTVFVRDTETFDIIKNSEGKKKSLRFLETGLQTFKWSPRDNIIAVWNQEKGNNPARLSLYEVPSFREMASRSRTQCKAVMHWHPQGDFLALLVTALNRNNKECGTNVEIFRLRVKNTPVDVVQIKDGKPQPAPKPGQAQEKAKVEEPNIRIIAFEWEPNGRRFGIISANDTGHQPKLAIYEMKSDRVEMVVSHDLPSGSYNELHWAPEGQYFVLAAVGPSGGDMLFCGVSPQNKFDVLHKEEHFMLCEVKWSPCSRYVITSVNTNMREKNLGFRYQGQAESGFRIWSFHGRLLFSQQKEKLYICQWRPHPPSLMDEKRVKEIRRDIKSFSKRYDAIDDQQKDAARRQFQQARDSKMNAFQAIMDRLQEWKEERNEENHWLDAVQEYEESQEWIVEEHVVQEEVGCSEELITS
jgi:translation initiation factor 3 subunit B